MIRSIPYIVIFFLGMMAMSIAYVCGFTYLTVQAWLIVLFTVFSYISGVVIGATNDK